MYRLAVLLCLLCPVLASAEGFHEVQPTTRAKPTGDATDPQAFPARPLNLALARTYRVTVCAPVGATLTGTGSVRLWLWHPGMQRWGYNTRHDLTVNATAECQSWGLPVDVRYGFLLPASTAVGVSAGTTVIVHVDADGS